MRRQKVRRRKARRKQDDAALNGLLASDLRRQLPHGDVRHDGPARRDEQTRRRAAETLPHHAPDIRRPPRRHAVVADVPQRDRAQQHHKAALDFFGEFLAAVRLLLHELLLGMLGLVFLLRRRELRLVCREVQHDDRNRHQHRHDDKKRLVVHMLGPRRLAVRIQHRRHDQIRNAADRAHQVDDRVRARA